MNEKIEILSVNMFSRGIRPVGLTPFAHQQSQNWFFYPISGTLNYSDSDVECVMKKGNLYLLPYKKAFSLRDIEGVNFNHLYIAFNSTQPFYEFMQFDVNNDSFLKNYLQFLNNNYKKIQTDSTEINDTIISLTTALLNHLFPNKTTSNNFATQLKKFIDDNLPSFDIDAICEHFNYSRRYLDLKFKQIYGISVFQYAKNKQFAIVANMLTKNFALNDICDAINYSSTANLSRDFKKHVGMTPLEYRAFINENKPTKGPKQRIKQQP